jgi:hypothetical protein
MCRPDATANGRLSHHALVLEVLRTGILPYGQDDEAAVRMTIASATPCSTSKTVILTASDSSYTLVSMRWRPDIA